ncbi:MAG: DUF4954 family protein [Muribaculaceae bacterium]
MEFRNLRDSEIMHLIHNKCNADDWNNIIVAHDFDAQYINNVQFSGKIRLGNFYTSFTLDCGIVRHSEIKNASLHNCIIGNNVYINNVANHIANYKIGDNAYIENVSRIECIGNSSFGNGVKISVLNESGGREVPIYDNLSTHMAYMLAMYRYRPKMIEKASAFIQDYSLSICSDFGEIGTNTRILNTGVITNVKIGNYSLIEGASNLENGTIVGSQKDNVFIGHNVMAKDFIICSGAHIEDGVVLLHSFIGQGCHISHLFSAHDSMFFANCSCENGEAAAIFAGPYTVSMHKSSLLIAGMFSFLNAGSGSNQSNHMYKLGPIHQGVVERGSKTTSDSYILWPAKIGAFSLVMGRHVSHPDTSLLPFSYLIENKGRSYLVPGVNLKSVGTIRDAQKWPKRDKRKDDYNLDLINFNLLSPYTIGRMMQGIKLLDTLESTSGLTADRYTYQSMTIEPHALRKGREYYCKAINKFMGNSIIKRLEGININNDNDIHQALTPTINEGTGEWLDISGLIMPKSEVTLLVDNIENGKISSVKEIEQIFAIQHRNYYDMEWTWVVENFKDWYGKSITEIKATDIITIVELWKESVVSIDNMLYQDAKKEFSLIAKTGFGLDGCAARKDSDFEQVRGDFENDNFVKMVVDHIKKKTALGDNLIARLKANN